MCSGLVFLNCDSLFHNGVHIRWFDTCCYHLLCTAIKRNEHTRQGEVLLLINAFENLSKAVLNASTTGPSNDLKTEENLGLLSALRQPFRLPTESCVYPAAEAEEARTRGGKGSRKRGRFQAVADAAKPAKYEC